MSAVIFRFPAARFIRSKKQQAEMVKLYREAREVHPGDSARAWQLAAIAQTVCNHMTSRSPLLRVHLCEDMVPRGRGDAA